MARDTGDKDTRVYLCAHSLSKFQSKHLCFGIKHGQNLLLFAGIDPPDADKEKMGILVLQNKERDVPHSVRTTTPNDHTYNLQYFSENPLYSQKITSVSHGLLCTVHPHIKCVNVVATSYCLSGLYLLVKSSPPASAFVFLCCPPKELIIALLSNAVAQFKKYKCPRMKSHLSECFLS